MPQTVNLVFSEPPEGVTEEEFNAWYDAHLSEILSVPGFVAAQRYRIEPWSADPDEQVRFRFLAVFELNGELETIMAEMERMRLSRPELYMAMKETDTVGPPIPAWWPEIRWASWHCKALGDRVEAPD
jgi:hypothetical protein